MPKPLRGRAGREDRRADQRDTYGTELGQLLSRQLHPQPTGHLLHLGHPGAVVLLRELAPRLQGGSITLLVFSYDELIAARTSLADFPHVQVVNELRELDPQARYDFVTSIIPYHLGAPYVEELITVGLGRLKPTGVLLLAGDRQHEFERYHIFLATLVNPVTTLATSAHRSIIQAEAAAIRRRGGLVRR